MSPVTSFFIGVAVGAVIALVALALAQARGVADRHEKLLEAEDKVIDEHTKAREKLDAERRAAHEAIDWLTPEEIDLVLNGRATVDAVLRGRADKTPPGGGIFPPPPAPGNPGAPE